MKQTLTCPVCLSTRVSIITDGQSCVDCDARWWADDAEDCTPLYCLPPVDSRSGAVGVNAEAPSSVRPGDGLPVLDGNSLTREAVA